MAGAAAFDDDWDPRLRRRRGSAPRWVGPVALAAIVVGMLALFFLRAPTITDRERAPTTINVVLPPPPPPPPPEPQPIEQPRPETPTMVDEPVPQPDTPPPPTPAEPTAGNDALTAREGPGASNYGLAVGDGTGTRIGGRPGGSGVNFSSYGNSVMPMIQRAAQRDPLLARGRFRANVMVCVAANGQVSRVSTTRGTGDDAKDAALQTRISGLQLPAPPPGMPCMRVEVSSS